MRFLLDTNILIPLEDSRIALAPALAAFVRFANEYGHPLVYHPASERDIERDADASRRAQTLARLEQYVQLDHTPACPWNDQGTSENDAVDNEILFALSQHAARFLVTEDMAIHRKARTHHLDQKVFTIQQALDLLRRLHELASVYQPNISEVPLHALMSQLPGPFFNSLREGYPEFDAWFRNKAEEGRRAWVCLSEEGYLKGLCVFAIQGPSEVAAEGLAFNGPALKLCTFKVGDADRGQKIGELLLKTAFQFSSQNRVERIFLHTDVERQPRLVDLLEDHGFQVANTYGRDTVFIKEHPVAHPETEIDPVVYNRRYFPHYQSDRQIRKFIVPIVPGYHQVLFPDYHRDGDHRPLVDLTGGNTAGNAIKLAYLCHSQTTKIRPGDLVIFYRSHDHMEVTSLGVVEQVETLRDPDAIIELVKRRTVYAMEAIVDMAQKPTKVILFRLVEHFPKPARLALLTRKGILKAPPQSITEISHASYLKLMEVTRA